MGRWRPMLAGLLLVAAACSSTEESTTTAAPPAPTTTATTAPEAVGERQTLIVDYSPTVSDVGALLYLLSHPDVSILAITLPGTGEAGCELGYEVTFGILAMFAREDIPVACDPTIPGGANAWPAEFLEGHEQLTFGLPPSTAVPDPRSPAQLIVDTIADASDPVTIYAVAPLTNLANAIGEAAATFATAEGVVIMGGAVDAGGNVPGTHAEWNFHIDPAAAQAVLSSGQRITLVPLDATNDVPVPPLWQADLQAAQQTAAVRYLTGLVRIFPGVTSGFYYLWDELAGAVAAGEDGVSTEEAALAVVADGTTVRDDSAGAVTLSSGVPDPPGFYEHFLEVISGEAVERSAAVEFSEAPIVDANSTPVEVLAAWLFVGTTGDVEGAAALVAPGAPWVGFGASPEVFIDGSAPFEAYDVAVACIGAGAIAGCEMTFRDRWVDPIPELERASLSVEADVEDGVIVAFRSFAFGQRLIEAFDAHGSWLEAEDPARLGAACGADPAARPCSELFVETVEEWVASR